MDKRDLTSSWVHPFNSACCNCFINSPLILLPREMDAWRSERRAQGARRRTPRPHTFVYEPFCPSALSDAPLYARAGSKANPPTCPQTDTDCARPPARARARPPTRPRQNASSRRLREELRQDRDESAMAGVRPRGARHGLPASPPAAPMSALAAAWRQCRPAAAAAALKGNPMERRRPASRLRGRPRRPPLGHVRGRGFGWRGAPPA